MIRNCLLIGLFLVIISCSSDIKNQFETNKDEYKELVSLLEENSHVFFDNTPDSHRVFYTYVLNKPYNELPEKSYWNNIDEELFLKFQSIFKKLEIKEFYISNESNYYFKLENKDFILKSTSSFLGFSKNNFIENDMTYFGDCKVNSYDRIENTWYMITCNSSPAN